MSWVEDLLGFPEGTGSDVRAQLEWEDGWLHSRANGRRFHAGHLQTPSLAELRSTTPAATGQPVKLREIVADVRELHADPGNADAVFQAASQFNLLEMADPEVTPEEGVGIYEHDRTQGPICAIACGAGTVYRNYLVPLGDQAGQTSERQIDCLADLGTALGNANSELWEMCNGYAFLTDHGRETLNTRLANLSAEQRDELRGHLRIGVQRDTEVTLAGAGHRVTQVYGAALPIAYGGGRTEEWRGLAELVLEASYEATLRTAMQTAETTGVHRVFLTLLGGGVFGNPETWITGAIATALDAIGDAGLDISIVSYGASQPAVQELIARR